MGYLPHAAPLGSQYPTKEEIVMRQPSEISVGATRIIRGVRLQRKLAAIGIFSAVILMSNPALAEEDCFNGPVSVNAFYSYSCT